MSGIAAALLTALFAAAAGAQEPPERAPAPEARAADEREALRMLVALDRDQEAVARFAHRVRPGGPWAEDGEALALVARALAATGEAQEALALLRAAEPRTGATAVVLETARALLELDRLEEALEALSEPGEGSAGARRLRFPDEPDALLLLARIQVRRGRHEGVEAACRRFLELAPRHPEAQRAWYVLAQEALARGDARAAEEAFAEAARSERWNALVRARELQVLRAPDELLPRLGLALLWLEAGADERARAELEELARRHPGEPRPWVHLAEARRRLGLDPRDALERALALDPDHPEALLLLARALLEAPGEPSPADRERAAEALERLCAGPAGSEPRFREAWLLLAAERARRGDAAGAERARRRHEELEATPR